MTMQKPVAWLYDYKGSYGRPAVADILTAFDPSGRYDATDVRPLYERPAPAPAPAQPVPADAKPVAWRYEYFQEIDIWASVVTEVPPNHWAGREDVRNVVPLYEHPAPAQPATDPAIEAARRKALRAIFALLEQFKEATDGTGITVARGLLTDLVGWPRVFEGQWIDGYDASPLTGEFLFEFHKAALDIYARDAGPERILNTSATMRETRVSTADLAPPAPAGSANGPKGDPGQSYIKDGEYGRWGMARVTPPPPPARLSVDMLASIIANVAHAGQQSALSQEAAKAVHEAIYGKDA